ncbi:hypothetical protein NliqN6_3247 [Naganishia liquefaciens]|uniref:Uncharacterized protein n=1 Tax=Naganishia liquefaciens TaxID=104408 RepID=A0A8H3YEQ8_9TREE|nr:hypothetical protein NliqN6_3247 [Naganishia liquefaciens]
MTNGGYYVWVSLAAASIFIFLIITRMARIRQQRLHAARRANQALPSHDPRWPDYVHSGIGSDRWPYVLGNTGNSAQRQNDIVRVESSTRDPELPSYNAPAITIPQPAYNPTLAEPLPPPPAYIQKPEASQEEVSRQDTRVPSTEATSGLPGYDHATNRR